MIQIETSMVFPSFALGLVRFLGEYALSKALRALDLGRSLTKSSLGAH